MSEFSLLLQHLRQPEYLHVLLNPMPTYGMAAGAVTLLACLVLRKDPSAPLLWLVLTAIVSWQAVSYGHKGYDRVFAMSNPDARQWLDVHADRATRFRRVFYATGAAALAALVIGRRRPRAMRVLVLATVALAIFSMGLGGWISHAGGQVRHSEFREGPPPPEQVPNMDEHSDDHSHSHERGHP